MATQSTGLREIPISSIKTNTSALREVDETSVEFQEIVASVKEHGVLSAIVVRAKQAFDGETPLVDANGQPIMVFELWDGRHRLAAAIAAGLKTIPANIITTDNDVDMFCVQLVTNANKVETTPAQYADQLRRILLARPELTHADLGRMVSKSPSWVSQVLRLNKLAPEIKKAVDDGKMSVNNALSLTLLPIEEQPAFLAQAMSLSGKDFMAKCQERRKKIRESHRTGKDSKPAEYVHTPVIREKSALLSEMQSPTVIREAVAAKKLSDPVQIIKFVLAWVLKSDEESVTAAKSKFDEAQKKLAEERARAEAERERKRAEKEASKAANTDAKPEAK